MRSTLSPEQGQAILLLIEGHSPRRIAERVGVDRVTLWRWRQTPEFLAEYERQRAEALDTGMRTLQAAVGAATRALVEIAIDTEAERRDRIRAAVEILDRVGLVSTSRVEVAAVEADPEARLLELLGLRGEVTEGSQIIDVEPEQQTEGGG